MRPADVHELSRIIVEARATKTSLGISGAGSKRDIGQDVDCAIDLSMKAIRGVTLYEPGEMVMAARAGTPLSHIEAQLAQHGQMLGFEPVELAVLSGREAGQATIGGAVASNLSGARRLSAGSARDAVLGLSGINGRGELFRSGGRVLKNNAGYDVSRGLAGSWGTLAIFAEIAFKVVPAPEETLTLLFLGLPDEIAIEVLAAATASPYEISAAVHLQRPLVERLWHEGLRAERTAITAIRIENFSRLVAHRRARLLDELKVYGTLHEMDRDNSLAFWSELRQLSVLSDTKAPLWRISTAPQMGPVVVAAISAYMDCQAYYDWAGGLIWAEVLPTSDAGAADIRRVIATHGGHATLIRAAPEIRRAVEVFQPLEAGVMRLTQRLKESFDPAGILNPGRLYPGM